jgi:hypothetical protein
MNVFPRLYLGWTYCAKPSQAWGKLQCLYWQHCSSWNPQKTRCTYLWCATHVNWLSRLARNMKDFQNICHRLRYVCLIADNQYVMIDKRFTNSKVIWFGCKNKSYSSIYYTHLHEYCIILATFWVEWRTFNHTGISTGADTNVYVVWLEI